MTRTVLTGAAVVRPDRVEPRGTIVIEDGVITEVLPEGVGDAFARGAVRLEGRVVVPGFVDVHVHGAMGTDVMDGAGAVGRVAAVVPRWGVTAFSPTSLACPPAVLAAFLADVRAERGASQPRRAQVLRAHLESSFLNPDYRGAQPRECLCEPASASAAALLNTIDAFRDAIGVITLAPEMAGGVELVRRFVAAGHLVSLGHSGATFDQALAAIDAGATRATHLFNAMPAVSAREPGLVGAILAHEAVRAELICDAVHVHPSVMRVAIAAKTPHRILAITDGTAAAGLPAGSHAHLGPLRITASDVARLDDGSFGGSVLTMDRAFRTLVRMCGVDVVQAARMCATTPATDLGLSGHGAIVPGAVADLVVLDDDFRVERTYIGGELAWPSAAAP